MAWEIIKAVVVLWTLRWLVRLLVFGGGYLWLLEFTKNIKGW